MARKIQFILFISLTLLGIAGLFAFKHPFYLSVSDLKYNSNEQRVQGSVRLFINDFEDALSKITHQRVDLIHPLNKKEVDKLIEDYLKQRWQIEVNKKKLAYKILGYEIIQESAWVYLESDICEKPKSVQLDVSVLYDYLKSQANIVHIEANGQTKSSKVNCPDKTLLFDF